MSGAFSGYALYWFGFFAFAWFGLINDDGWGLISSLLIALGSIPVIVIIECFIWLQLRKKLETRRNYHLYILGVVIAVVLIIFDVREVMVPLSEMLFLPIVLFFDEIFSLLFQL